MAGRKPTRERLIGAALELFGGQGYHATSIAEILEVAGAHSGSLYHYFPAKEDLLIEVLERHRDGFERRVLALAWAEVDDPIERIFALLGHYRRRLVETEFAYASPVGSLALELHDPGPVVRRKIAQNFTVRRLAVERCLEEAGERLPPDVSRAELAGFVLATLEGAIMLARTYRDVAAFDAGVARMRDHFERLEADAKAPAG